MPQPIPFPLFSVYDGGLSQKDPRSLAINKSPKLRNVELRNNRPETTPGYVAHAGTDADTAANLGLFVAEYGTSRWLLKAEGGKIKKLKVVGTSPDAAWVTLKSGLNTTAKMEFAQAGDVVYATNGTDTVQKWDLTTTPASTADAAAVPKGTTIACVGQRLVTNDPTDKRKLNFSNRLAYETFASYKYIVDGEIARVMDDGSGNVLILANEGHGRYKWDGVDTSTSNPRKWGPRGTVAPRSVVLLPDGSVVYADHEGVWRSNDYTDVLLSDEISPLWRDLNHAKLADAAGWFHDNQYLLAVTDAAGTENDLLLAFDLELDGGAGGWLRHDIPAASFAAYADSNGVRHLIFGSPTANSKVYRRYQGLSDSEYNYNGAAIDAYYETREHDLKEVLGADAGRQKLFLKLNVSVEQKGDYSLTIGWRKDNDLDFNVTDMSLLGTGSELWSDTNTETWSDETGPDDVWGGSQRIEKLVPGFKLRGHTIQLSLQHNAINQPFTFYGATIYFIPLKGFK